MIKRLLVAVAATLAVGALGAPTATAAPGNGDPSVRPPGTDCVWIWTQGPPHCKKLE
ncbi:hypothetical protein VA596_00145 [Amycolatopsis sp., V23-08]|uniref:Uncharacterized protein n=1 Tax=Amycolatopsis heterodermiae TaxID=3110235 RepID=A0ABU5QVI6_9PSEU|nr:hypothetical protein [Amycolatopsis sp., V23-08]MEA5357926.1 hypothetical protein [Amycolatopsis sp., V23-08]